MQSDINKLSEEFELEMWLYIDGSLPEKRINFWNEQLKKYPGLKLKLEENEKIISLYEESAQSELNEDVYNRMIARATEDKKVFWYSIKSLFMSKNTSLFTQRRLTLAAAAAAVIIFLLLIIEKPGGDNIPSNGTLDWKGKELTTKLDKVDNSINTIKSESGVEYGMYRLAKDQFDVAIQSIGDKIEKLRTNMKNESL